jgi:tRNA-5-taurinomethyluridine 2-sulfurtransferase
MSGHYARAAVSIRTGESVLLRSSAGLKDQTFYLSQIPQHALSQTLFPLSGYTKSSVRKIAKSLLPRQIADKPDSQGLCFVEPASGKHFSTFLNEYIASSKPVKVVLESGLVVGTHPSIWYATIGQRCRLNFKESQQLNPGGQWYIAAKETDPPRYVIVPGKGHPRLWSKAATVRDWRWITSREDTPRTVIAQIRHRQSPVECEITEVEEGTMSVRFMEELYGVTPGQGVAVWDGARCLGGGVIDKSE